MLLVINGAPGIGKSTLARRYVDEVPLALLVEIDQIRMQLGGWVDREESRIVARGLAFELMRAHLRNDRDVVVAQFFGRPEFLAEMRDLAITHHTPLVEVCLTSGPEVLIEGFRARRIQYMERGLDHPQSDLDETSLVGELTRTNNQVVRDASARGSVILPVNGDVEESLDCLRAAVGTVSE